MCPSFFGTTQFQPTHPHGVRRRWPGRGNGQRSFNPRTRTGCDIIRAFGRQEFVCFNPRTRTGCDGDTRGPVSSSGCFNPRTRTGCDAFLIQDLTFVLSFQPTHPHGVRPVPPRMTSVPSGFNPRTRTGCDCAICTSPTYGNSFNPRTRTGCDAWDIEGDKPFSWVSTHAPARGATQATHFLRF